MSSSVGEIDHASVEQVIVTEYENVLMALMKLVAVSIECNTLQT